MPSLNRYCQTRRPLCVAPVIGFFVAFYLYVLLRVRPELFYQQKPDVFLFDSYFFTTYVNPPGGLVEYASAFLSPLFAFGWLGALVITFLAAIICLATRRFLAAIAESSATKCQVVFLIPALLILVMLGRYNHPVSLCVGLGVVLLLACAYAWVGRWHAAVRWTVFMIASVLAYYVAAGLYVVFAVLCAILEWTVRRHRPLAVWCALSTVAVPIVVGTWLYDLSIQDAYRGLLLPTARYWLAVPSSALVSLTIRVALLLFFPVAALAVAWRRRPAGSPDGCPGTQAATENSDDASPDVNRPKLRISNESSRIPKNSGSGLDSGFRNAPNSWEFGYAQLQRLISGLRLAAPSAILIGMGIGADLALFDVPTKDSLLVAYHAERQQWTDVLTHAQRLPPSDVWNVFHVNRALYQRGELLERMFAYPQVVDAAPTLTLHFESLTTTAQRVPLECSDILFDLGRINESQHMAYEALEQFGERSHTLRRLVYLHAIKGEPDAARRFLAVLERSLGQRRWARDCLRQLDADPTLSNVPAVASRRELMVVRDVAGELNLETMLVQLLERNPRNRMAFEYLMAHYLLTRRLDKLAANLHRLDDFDHAGLPRHCAEALVIYLEGTGSQAIDLGGRKIRPETWRRNGEFVQAMGRYQGNAQAAFTALHRDFGDTYFFFYVFGHNDLPL